MAVTNDGTCSDYYWMVPLPVFCMMLLCMTMQGNSHFNVKILKRLRIIIIEYKYFGISNRVVMIFISFIFQ